MSAIAEKLRKLSINVSKNESFICLLDSFHRDRPKSGSCIPSWNLFLVLYQLTVAPLNLTFKTMFLLFLGSGKSISEIHAWLSKNTSHQSDWSKVSVPSPSFLSKHQLAKEGPDIVALLVIQGLVPNSETSKRWQVTMSCQSTSLLLHHCRTSDIRQNKYLVFVSFKKGFDKGISPATISSTGSQVNNH